MAEQVDNQVPSGKVSGKFPVTVAGPYPAGDFSDDPNSPDWSADKPEPVADVKPAKPKKARD